MKNIPKKEDIYNSILQQYAEQLNVQVSELDKSFIVEAKVKTGYLYPLYLRLIALQRNIYPDLCDEETLLRVGFQILNRFPSPATQGKYICEATGANGQVIPESNQFVANDETSTEGSFFITDENNTIVGTSADIQIRSLEAGRQYLLKVDDTLTSVSPLPTDNIITVKSVVESPVDAESIESYRLDVLDKMRIINASDCPAAYRLWCLDIGEIFQVYPYLETAGKVVIYVEVTDEATSTNIVENPNNVKGVPTQLILDRVYTAPDGINPESGVIVFDEIESQGRRPIGIINLEAKSIVPVGYDIEITGLMNTSYMTNISSALESLFKTYRPFIAGADNLSNKRDILTRDIIVSEMIKAMVGTSYTSISIKINTVENTTYRFDNGEIPYLKTLTNV